MFGLSYTCPSCDWSELDVDPKHDNFVEVERGHLKLVRPPKREWIERFAVDQDAHKRDMSILKIMRGILDLLGADLDRDEVDASMAYYNLSQQEIDALVHCVEALFFACEVRQ